MAGDRDDTRLQEVRERLRAVHDPVALLEGMFAYLPVGLQVYAADGHCLLTNRAFREMFGSEPPPGYNVLRDEIAEAQGVLGHVRRAFAGETVELPAFWYDPRELTQVTVTEGRRVAIESTFFPLFGAAGAVSHVAIVFKDVTSVVQERERAERSERRYRTLTESMALMFWSTNPRGETVADSPSWRAFTGQTLAQWLGYGWLDALHPDDRERTRAAWAQAAAAGTTYEVEYRVRRADGTYATTVAHGAPVRDASGEVVEWVGMNRDVTVERRLAEQLAIFADVIENSPDFVGIADAEGRPFYVNPAARRMVELPDELDVTDTEIADWYPPELRQLAQDAIVPAVLREGRWSGETFFRNWRTGAWIPVSDSHFIVRERGADRRLGMATITRDISDRRQAEREREELLARERAARAEAEAASRAKDEFLAMLGHELRNPLSPIVTALQLMKLRGDDRSTREQQVIERQVHHLVRLVDDLLDVSRITRGKVELKREPVELAAVVAKAVEIASPLLEQRRHYLTVEVAPGLCVFGDPVRLAQVVANLLTNAARYTEPGGRVAVRAAREGQGHASLSVQDTGIGLSPELVPRVFDLFVQGPRAVDRAEGGLGLGLALVKSLVEMHGGEVAARSEGPGRGSEFVVRLPLHTPAGGSGGVGGGCGEQPAARPSDRPPRAPSARCPRAVLVVDDNADAAEMLADVLRSAGHRVEVAHDGPAALAALERFAPEVALLDIGLPVMDGYELAARLRSRVGGALRIVALTGYGQDADRERSRAAGFVGHLIKPVDAERLLALLDAEPR